MWGAEIAPSRLVRGQDLSPKLDPQRACVAYKLCFSRPFGAHRLGWAARGWCSQCLPEGSV